MKLTRRNSSGLAGPTILAAVAPQAFAPARVQSRPLRLGIIAPGRVVVKMAAMPVGRRAA